MALTSEGNGTQLAVISTEHTLFTGSGVKSYMAYVDVSNMAASDILEIRIKVMINSVAITVLMSTYTDVTTDAPIMYAPPIPSSLTNGYIVTIKQTAGTGRNYDWRVFSV